MCQTLRSRRVGFVPSDIRKIVQPHDNHCQLRLRAGAYVSGPTTVDSGSWIGDEIDRMDGMLSSARAHG
jgi:hypothetical protein